MSEDRLISSRMSEDRLISSRGESTEKSIVTRKKKQRRKNKVVPVIEEFEEDAKIEENLRIKEMKRSIKEEIAEIIEEMPPTTERLLMETSGRTKDDLSISNKEEVFIERSGMTN